MSDVGFLASTALLNGLPERELTELARVLRRRRFGAGEVLWREGEPASAMLLIEEGRVALSLQLPGGRTIEVATSGRGEVLGEIPLIDGGRHAATAIVTEAATLLSLSAADFAALVSRRHPTAFTLKRRVAHLACARLRHQIAGHAESIGGGPPAAHEPPGELEFRGPPDSRYVRRLANFHAFDPLALWGLLTASRFAMCPSGRTLVAEGESSEACYLTINGAVEKVVARGGRRIRVGLAGPGLAFGYESLIDGGPAPVTATTRERTLLLVLPRAAFDRLFHGDLPESQMFLDVINRDLMASLRQALRPNAHLATSL